MFLQGTVPDLEDRHVLPTLLEPCAFYQAEPQCGICVLGEPRLHSLILILTPMWAVGRGRMCIDSQDVGTQAPSHPRAKFLLGNKETETAACGQPWAIHKFHCDKEKGNHILMHIIHIYIRWVSWGPWYKCSFTTNSLFDFPSVPISPWFIRNLFVEKRRIFPAF